MPELGPYGSVRGARGNSRPYRDPRSFATETRWSRYVRLFLNLRHDLAPPRTTQRAIAQSRCAPARCAGAGAERPVAGREDANSRWRAPS